MSEPSALLAKARRYLKSAKLLLQDGDYEAVPVVSDEDANDVLGNATEFCATVERWINKTPQ